MNVVQIYQGSDGQKTKRLFDELILLGSLGLLAMNLFRTQKASSRAKVYHGGNLKGRYKDQAYAKKQWSMYNLVHILDVHGKELGIEWGWGEDLKRTYHNHVLYVELPNGQVSWHTDWRGYGPDYTGKWDGASRSEQRIVLFCQGVLDGRVESLSRMSKQMAEDE